VISLQEARAYVLGACTALPARPVGLADALGLVAVEGFAATELVPPFANSAVDGFAVRAADVAGATEQRPARLEVIGTIRAGMAPDHEPGAGQAVRIMTGAPVPSGADAVVMVERTAVAPGGAVDVFESVTAGTAVRPAGDDLRPGDPVYPAGDALTAGHLGVLATFGVEQVEVVPRARVGVLSTGDELVEGAVALAPGQIRDSNRRTLLALVDQAGADAIDLGRIPDDEAAITDAIERGVSGCDLLLTSGGVSMGDFDYVKVVLDRLGDMRWMQVAIRPAKPLAFGTVACDGRAVPVVGLPGNPVSSVVSFELFARPALRRLMGFADDQLDRPRVAAVADQPLTRRPDGKVHFARVVARVDADGRHHVRSAGGQGSHQLSALVGANALAVLPDGEGVEDGGTVDVLLLR
jgi:molybdenum cofactor synthesis domain-containing protein